MPLSISITETPIRPATTNSMIRAKTRAVDIEHAVRPILRYHCRVAETSSFLGKIFSFEDDSSRIDKIYRKLVQDGCYNEQTKRWMAFPNPRDTLEMRYYKPFVKIGEAIFTAATTLGLLSPKLQPDSKTVHGLWIDSNNQTPISMDEMAALIRPDLCFVSPSEDLQGLPKKINELETNIHAITNPGGVKRSRPLTSDESKDLSKLKKKLVELIAFWWLQIHVPVEVKPIARGQTVYRALMQLAGYMRQILREQLDRRFVIGIAFCHDQLSVWQSDRSGMVGTATPINIHEEPKEFIRVLAGLLFLPPHRLGWDPSMKLFLPDKGRGIPSYTYFEHKKLAKSVYRMPWLIEMPGKMEPTSKSTDKRTVGAPLKEVPRESFVTVRALSAVGAEVMQGRATIVWEAVKYSEFREPKRLYVLKQNWRPYHSSDPNSTSEGLMYQAAGQFTGRIYCYEDCLIDGKPDSTLEFIRQGLELKEVDMTGPSPPDWYLLPLRDEAEEPSLHTNSTTEEQITEFLVDHKSLIPVSRVFSRTLMEVWGYPVKYFKDLRELLSVFRDAIKDHQHSFNRGILHRDISTGNIIIDLLDDKGEMDAGRARGRLIDYDHSKMTENFKARDLPATSDDLGMKSIITATLAYSSIFVDDEIIEKSMQMLSNPLYFAALYIKDAVQRVQEFAVEVREPSKLYSCQDLGWTYKDEPRPYFLDKESRPGIRTGTLPFMSSEVLTQEVTEYFDKENSLPFTHDAVHDIESFFWVLLCLCLTRQSGGSIRRAELQPMANSDITNEIRALKVLVHNLFDGSEPTITTYKTRALNRANYIKEEVLPFIHDYFFPLKGLLGNWWRVMRLAYVYRACEYNHIHEIVLALLEETLVSLPDSQNVDAAASSELERRRTEYQNSLDTFNRTKTTVVDPEPQQSSIGWGVGRSPNNASVDSKADELDEPQSPTPARKKAKREDIRR